MNTRAGPVEAGRRLLEPGHDVGVGDRLGEDRSEHGRAEASAASRTEPTLSRARERRPRTIVPSSWIIVPSSSRSVEGRVALGRTARARPPTSTIATAASTAGHEPVSSTLGGGVERQRGAATRDQGQPVEEQLHREIATGGTASTTTTASVTQLDPTGPAGRAQSDAEHPQGRDVVAIAAQVPGHARAPGRAARPARRRPPSARRPGPGRPRAADPATAYVVERLASVPVASLDLVEHRVAGCRRRPRSDLRAGHGRPGADHARWQVGQLRRRCRAAAAWCRADRPGTRSSPLRSRASGSSSSATSTGTGWLTSSSSRASGVGPGGHLEAVGTVHHDGREASKRVKRSLAAVSMDGRVRPPGLVEQVSPPSSAW